MSAPHAPLDVEAAISQQPDNVFEAIEPAVYDGWLVGLVSVVGAQSAECERQDDRQ